MGGVGLDTGPSLSTTPAGLLLLRSPGPARWQCQGGLLAGDRQFGPKEGIPGHGTSPLAGVLTGPSAAPLPKAEQAVRKSMGPHHQL